MGCFVIGYIVFLTIDVLVGTSFIVWKCVIKEEESECKLATAGTLGSVGIWLILLLVCPFCMTRFDHKKILIKLREKLERTAVNLRPRRTREIDIQSEIYLPTTLSFRGKGHMMTPCDQGKVAPHFNDSEKIIQHLTVSEVADTNSHPDVVYTYQEDSGSLVRVPLLKYLSQDEP